MSESAVREALAELEQAESHYRLTFQIAPSEAHLDIGRAWDRMKKAGDKARAALAQSEQARGYTDITADGGMDPRNAAPPPLAVRPLTDEQIEGMKVMLTHYHDDPRVQCLRSLVGWTVPGTIERALAEANGMTLETKP